MITALLALLMATQVGTQAILDDSSIRSSLEYSQVPLILTPYTTPKGSEYEVAMPDLKVKVEAFQVRASRQGNQTSLQSYGTKITGEDGAEIYIEIVGHPSQNMILMGQGFLEGTR